jgi:hypothetical protein
MSQVSGREFRKYPRFHHILTKRWALKCIEDHDELKQGKTALKKIILDLEELVFGNAAVKAFDEIFKVIYAKLFDQNGTVCVQKS